MRAFLGTVLSVIAVGVLLIAYGLLGARAAAAPFGPQATDPYAAVSPYPYQTARPVPASDIVALGQAPAYAPYGTSHAAIAYPVNDVRAVPAVQTAAPPRRVNVSNISRGERTSGRDWKKTALIVGGTTAAGAGLGAIFGGGKGALIGAAIGGGASTIYEATRH